jgi:hypothetical protein
MKFLLIKTPEGFEAEIFDEEKMIPDPAFRRVFKWHPFPELAPRGPKESEKDFKKRESEAAAELESYMENIRVESLRLYQADLAARPRVVVAESVL